MRNIGWSRYYSNRADILFWGDALFLMLHNQEDLFITLEMITLMLLSSCQLLCCWVCLPQSDCSQAVCIEALNVKKCFIHLSTLSNWPQVSKDLSAPVCVYVCVCVCVWDCVCTCACWGGLHIFVYCAKLCQCAACVFVSTHLFYTTPLPPPYPMSFSPLRALRFASTHGF